MELYEQITYKGHHINIYYDADPQSPREWDNLGTFYTSHPHYRPEEDFYRHFEREEVFDEYRDFLDSFEKKYIALKIYLYDHSGLTISSGPFACRWDSGLFGMVAVNIDKVKKEYGWKKITAARRRKIESYLQSEIDTYDQYLRGEVYGYRITPESDDSDLLESGWGFFGDEGIETIKSECRATIDALVADRKKQEWEARLRISGPELPFSEFALSTI